MNVTCVHLIFRMEYEIMSEICLTKGENDKFSEICSNFK